MFPDIINIAVAGLIAGFIFSMPIAGPIAIVIVSNALEGKLRYCKRTAIGASIVEFIYVFIVIIGIKSLYSLYEPYIPYLILAGSVVLIFIGYKIMMTKLDFEKMKEVKQPTKEENKGGLRAGLFINFTNPTLFLGWLGTSFLVFTFMANLGIGTGGLDIILQENISSVQEMVGDNFEDLSNIDPSEIKEFKTSTNENNNISPVLLAFSYSSMVAIGAFLWLYFFAKFLVKYRQKIKVGILNKTIQILGVVLLLIAVFLMYKAAIML